MLPPTDVTDEFSAAGAKGILVMSVRGPVFPVRLSEIRRGVVVPTGRNQALFLSTNLVHTFQTS